MTSSKGNNSNDLGFLSAEYVKKDFYVRVNKASQEQRIPYHQALEGLLGSEDFEPMPFDQTELRQALMKMKRQEFEGALINLLRTRACELDKVRKFEGLSGDLEYHLKQSFEVTLQNQKGEQYPVDEFLYRSALVHVFEHLERDILALEEIKDQKKVIPHYIGLVKGLHHFASKISLSEEEKEKISRRLTKIEPLVREKIGYSISAEQADIHKKLNQLAENPEEKEKPLEAFEKLFGLYRTMTLDLPLLLEETEEEVEELYQKLKKKLERSGTKLPGAKESLPNEPGQIN